MNAKQSVSETEFGKWLRPVSVLAMAETQNFHTIALMIGDALLKGDILAAAATLNFEDATVHRGTIPKGLWRGWFSRNDTKFWATGDYTREIANQSGREPLDSQIKAYGVRFRPDGIIRLFPDASNRPVPSGKTRGGRRAGTNGEPIARLAKRLLALSSADLASYKVEAVASELCSEYEALGLRPPHEDNARGDARGILKAIRERGET